MGCKGYLSRSNPGTPAWVAPSLISGMAAVFTRVSRLRWRDRQSRGRRGGLGGAAIGVGNMLVNQAKKKAKEGDK